MDEVEPYYVPDRDFAISSGDTGQTFQPLEDIIARTPAGLEDENDKSLSPELREKYQLEKELSILERSQPPMLEEMYFLYKQDFRNDSERIYFLQLPSIRDRENYLVSKGMKKQSETPQYLSDLNSKDDQREILTGMSPIQVRKIAGNPSFIEEVSDQRMRWGFYLPRSRVRYIYFDSGQVQGWTEEVFSHE